MTKKEVLLKVAFFGRPKLDKKTIAYNKEIADLMNEQSNLDLINKHMDIHSKKIYKKNLADLSKSEWHDVYQKALDSSGINKKILEIQKKYYD